MTNLYRLTNKEDGSQIMMIGTCHIENPEGFPKEWMDLLMNYKPKKLFVEIAPAQDDTPQSLPTMEYLKQRELLHNDETTPPPINALTSFEKIFILAHSLSCNYDKVHNILKQIAVAWWGPERDTPDYSKYLEEKASHFEGILKEQVTEAVFLERKLFFESLNHKGLGYSMWNIQNSHERPKVQLDDWIIKKINDSISNLKIISLETDSDRDHPSTSHHMQVDLDMDDTAGDILKAENDKYTNFTICENLSPKDIEDIENCESFNARNSQWLVTLLKQENANHMLICVGDYHMIGKNGLLKSFHALGYDKIERFDDHGAPHEFNFLKCCASTDMDSAGVPAAAAAGSPTATSDERALEEAFEALDTTTDKVFIGAPNAAADTDSDSDIAAIDLYGATYSPADFA